MKKIYSLFLLLIVNSITFAQDKKFTFGIKGGYVNSWTNFKNNGISKNRHRNSFGVGGFGNYKVTKMLSVQLELLYMQKGWYFDIPFPYDPQKFKFNFSYLDLPILIKLDFHKGEFYPYLITGIAPSLFLGGEQNFTYLYGGGTTPEPTKITGVNALTLGWIGGAGLEYKHFIIETRTSIGLTHIEPMDLRRFISISVLAGYKF